MAAIVAQALSYRYGRTLALDALDLTVPEGSMYALLGPNGSGKTTLMQILAGMRRASHGSAHVLGRDVRHLSVADRQRIAYVAEGQRLPAWMRLDEWEAYLAPLYPTWDHALAKSLRDRFGLDPKRKLGALSRGTAMKAALLGALAPRPQLLFMDEPFTGMDVIVKDELVRGLLDSAGQESWTRAALFARYRRSGVGGGLDGSLARRAHDHVGVDGIAAVTVQACRDRRRRSVRRPTAARRHAGGAVGRAHPVSGE